MKKIIKIEIEIEKQFNINLKAEFKISEMLFTEYDNLFDYDSIKENYKKVLKKLEGFNMITATLFVYNDGEWRMGYDNIKSSFRYVNRSGEIKKSKWYGNGYLDFADAMEKNVLSDIKEMVEAGNKTYIELIKSNN
jgi:hypothetical protein